MKSVAPNLKAKSFLRGLVSMAMIRSAPPALEPWIAAKPTQPIPKTATLDPLISWILVAAP